MIEREPYAGRIGDEYDEREFTEWLAGVRPIHDLDSPQQYREEFERTIGVELWSYEAEVNYDGESKGYTADIVARGFDGDSFADVVIEAQFDQNKHSAQNHLGKLLLYGNLEDADVLVWLVDAELDSRMYETVAWLAPQLSELDVHVVETDVTSGPDGIEALGFTRVVPERPARGDDESVLAQRQRRFWGQFVDELDGDIVDRNRDPSAGAVHKQGRAISIAGVRAELVIDSNETCSKVRVRFKPSAPTALYAAVAAARDDIEQRVSASESWEWDDPDGSPPFTVTVRRDGLDLDGGTSWTTHRRWLETVLQRIRDEIVDRHERDQ